jgi:P2 family phage contractile tail tube protein
MSLQILTAATLYLGADPTASKHSILKNFTLPNIEYVTVEHMAAGAPMGVTVSMNTLKPLEFTFQAMGFDEEMYRLIASRQSRLVTVRGAIHDKENNRNIGLIATIKGVTAKLAADQFDRSKGVDHDYAITEVTRYKLEIADRVWIDIDVDASRVEVNGNDEWAETRALLGLS